MQKASDLFIKNIKNLPIWVKQVITKEINEEISNKLNEFSQLVETDNLFQYMCPKLTFKGKQELQERAQKYSEGYYIFMQDILDNNNMFEITIKNHWTFADTAKIFVRLMELEYVQIPDQTENSNIAVALFIAGKIKTGEFLKRIGKINVLQLEQAIRYQKELMEEGRHIKMASILIKLGFISDKGLDSLLLLKEEAKRHMSCELGITSLKYESPQEQQDLITRMQKEVARLENENLIMKKRLKKLLNIND